jgi:hypothetical protein
MDKKPLNVLAWILIAGFLFIGYVLIHKFMNGNREDKVASILLMVVDVYWIIFSIGLLQ